ncbi:hypothetical protein PV515_46465, partial [Streptomyces scabiei]|nr:hypothetical protein [Streptomyces scabiei]
MTRPPTIAQLRNLVDRAAQGLTLDEQARLRAGIDRLAHTETALARIAAIAEEYPASIDTALILEALPDPASEATKGPAVDRQTAVVLAALHHSAEADVTRVISLYERWVKAGPPPLGTSISRWWDKRLAELHHAIRPPTQEQRERPTHPDGTPYSYAEITTEGWGHCDGCRTWTTATPEHPHQCPQTNMRGPVTGQPQPQP